MAALAGHVLMSCGCWGLLRGTRTASEQPLVCGVHGVAERARKPAAAEHISSKLVDAQHMQLARPPVHREAAPRSAGTRQWAMEAITSLDVHCAKGMAAIDL